MKPLVGVIMGSASDWDSLRPCRGDARQTRHCTRGAGGLRAPHTRPAFLSTPAVLAERGLEVLIAGAGGAAHLPGMTAAKTRPAGCWECRCCRVRSMEWIRCSPIVQMPAGNSGGHLCDRRRRRDQRGLVCRCDPGCATSEHRGSPIAASTPSNRSHHSRPSRSAESGGMTVGIVGAGQLGRMLALAGYPLGLDFVFLGSRRVWSRPASWHWLPTLVGEFTDLALLRKARQTLRGAQFRLGVEHLRHWHLRFGDDAACAPALHPHRPHRCVRWRSGQESPRRKNALFRERLACAPHALRARRHSRADLQRACDRIGVAGWVLKTRRYGGYTNGKGQIGDPGAHRPQRGVAGPRRYAVCSTRNSWTSRRKSQALGSTRA